MALAQFPDTEIAKLLVNNLIYPNWKTVRVNDVYGRSYIEFEFESVEPSDIPPDQLLQFQIWPQMRCQVVLAGIQVCNGVIEVRESAFTSKEKGLHLYGRDDSKNACDCSVSVDGGQTLMGTFTSIGNSVLAGTGVGLNAPGDSGVVFPYFSVQQGETPWQVLERLSRYQPGMRMRSDGFGTIQAENGNDLPFGGSFIEGQNILESRAKIDITRAQHTNDAKAQRVHDDEVSSSDASEVEASVIDPTIDGRRYQLTVCEEPCTPQLVFNRAAFEHGITAQEIIEVTVKVYGWLTELGELYKVGRKWNVYSPIHGLNRVLFSREVTFEQDDKGGTFTTIVLCTPESMSDVLLATGTALPTTFPINAQTSNTALADIDPNNAFFGQGVTQSQITNPNPTPAASSGQPAK